MYGFRNTQALKWGMSGWNATTAGSWNGKIGAEEAKGHANWSYDPAPTNLVFTNPVISTLSTDGAAILKSRIEAAVAEGFKTVTGTEVLNTPANYFVHNYFNAADYAAFGHIKNADRINPLLLADNSYLNLDPNPATKIVNYCYTGQTSAIVTAYLRVMGYNAYSMTFGMNGLYNTNTAWTTNKWGVAPNVPKNLPFATN
jgi:rhodanese-related sulfurtransferase